MLENGQKSAMRYWLTVFSLMVSTASLERDFSTFGFVHTKLHNQLSPASVEKLVFIKFNANDLVDSAEVDDFKCYDERSRGCELQKFFGASRRRLKTQNFLEPERIVFE
uniref:HAT C-terminal dimerisation domain-containing protein n=1 Tax=Romanomermis culicivorax TaxID=13658 RepID=A0A915IBT3_ROMCU